jgi:hypothetical protein
MFLKVLLAGFSDALLQGAVLEANSAGDFAAIKMMDFA